MILTHKKRSVSGSGQIFLPSSGSSSGLCILFLYFCSGSPPREREREREREKIKPELSQN